jgi:myo-inositol-1(or 4)-monophosphatase
MAVRSPLINVMTSAALKAARGLLRDFGEVEQLQVSVKGPGDFVTQADLKAEKTLRAEPSTAPPISCTAFPSSASRSPWSATARSSPA